MTGTVAVIAAAVLTAWALWLADRRRRERDLDLTAEVHACRRAIERLTEGDPR